MRACSHCGEGNADRARFCQACGTALPEVALEHESRKVVTVVFCDVVGSTAMGERRDPESVRRVMSRYFQEMRAVLERHGGTVEKFIGDAIMAVFGVPRVHEDDALRAVRAVAEMRDALAGLNAELERDWGLVLATRVGVNTGETVIGDPAAAQTLVTGDAVNVAARLEQAAHAGHILLGSSTYRLVRHAVRAVRVEPIEAKGKTEALTAYRLLEVEAAGAAPMRSDAQLVGRTRELRMVVDAYEHAANDRACHLVTILGVAGVGKSRLVAEALASLPPEARVLTGRCLPYGDGITFWPVAEIVKQAAEISDAENAEQARAKIRSLVSGADAEIIVAGVCALVGLAPPSASLEQSFWATRRLLESMASARPLAIALDDLQWAEPALLDLIEHVADWSRDAPIIVVCMARPEFLEVRPGWGGGKLNAASILLAPLSIGESTQMMQDLLPGGSLPATLPARLLDVTEGNPLFLEEILASLIEEGRLVRSGDTWQIVGDGTAVADTGALEIPPTVQALLAARLDRLDAGELTVIEGAAVVGQVFYRGAVSDLAPEGLRPDVGTFLMGLVRKDLVRPDPTPFAGEEAFRFRHLLIRDAAYQAMPKRTRAELHERFARWLERTAGDRLTEYEEIVGYHLEQSFRYREELGPVDDDGRSIGAEAGVVLGRAGVRATKRSDFVAAASLLSRALSLHPDGPDAVEWLLRLSRMQHALDDATLARSTMERAVAKAADLGAPAAIWRTRVAYKRFLLFVEPHWPPGEARSLADAAIPELEAAGDDFGLALAFRLLGDAEGYMGQFEAWGRASQRAMKHARDAGDREIEDRALCDYEQALVYGPVPVPTALDLCRRIEGNAQMSQGTRLWTIGMIALLEAMAGDLDASKRRLVEADAMVTDLGYGRDEALSAELEGQIDLLAGDAAAAADRFRWEIDQLREHGEAGLGTWVMGFLCEALYLQEEFEEAEALCRESARLAPTDVFSQLRWRSVQAKILARRGAFDEAEILAGEVMERSATTDLLQLRGDLHLDMAEVLRMAGRIAESEGHIREALELYERKGCLLLADRTRARLA